MDPVSGLGLLSLVKDVVELGFKLKSSAEKSKWNRKRLRRLADEVLSDLYAFQALYDERKDMLEGSSLHRLALSVDKLRSELWRVCNKCQAMISSDSQSTSIKAIGSSLKAWNNRDVIEQEISDLRNRVRDCYLHFTTLTVARIESTVLVHRTENSLMLRRLELAGNQMLLSSDYGQNILSRIGKEIIECSDTHSVERQYFSLQVTRLSEMVPEFLRCKSDPSILTEYADNMLSKPFELVQVEAQPLDTLIRNILQLSGKFQNSEVLSSADVAFTLSNICEDMNYDSMLQEEKALGMAAAEFYRAAATHNLLVMPFWALNLSNLSWTHRALGQHQEASSHAKNALTILDMVQLSEPNKMVEIRPLCAYSRCMLSLALEELGQEDESLISMREAVEHFEIAIDAILCTKGCLAKGGAEQETTSLSDSERDTIDDYFGAIDDLSRMTQERNPTQAFEMARKALDLPESLSSADMPGQETIRQMYLRAMSSLTTAYMKGDGAAHWLAEEAVILFRRLSKIHPRHFSFYFLRVLYIYICVQQAIAPTASRSSPLLETQAEILRTLLYDGAKASLFRTLWFFPEGKLRLDAERIKALGPLENVIHDMIYAAGNTRDVDLYEINFEVAGGIRSFIGLVIRQHPQEATKGLELFKVKKPHISLLSSVMMPAEYLPISFLRAALELSNILDRDNDTKDSDQPSESLKFQTYCQAALYNRALEVIQDDSAPDFGFLAEAQAFTGRYEEAEASYRTSLNRHEPQENDKTTTLYNFMNATFQQRRYRYAVQLAKEYHDYLGDKIQMIEYSLFRAKAYLGEGYTDSAILACERSISHLRAEVVKGWCLSDHFGLAYSLAIMAQCLTSIGSLESAYGCAEESASFYRIYDFSDELYRWMRRFDRAYAFWTYALTLTLLGEHERALVVAKSAATIYEEVEQDTPICGADQADCLETLAKVHWALGQKSEAITVQKEATEKWVKIASQLAHLGKDTALSFDTLGDYLDAEGKPEDASKAREDSAEWRARHVEDQCEPLDKSYWDLFPEDCPEGFDPSLGRIDLLEDQLLKDEVASSPSSGISVVEDEAQNLAGYQEVKTSETGPEVDRITSYSTPHPSSANGEVQSVGADKTSQRSEVREATSSISTRSPPSSMVSSAMGWFDKLVEQSVGLLVDSVAVV